MLQQLLWGFRGADGGADQGQRLCEGRFGRDGSGQQGERAPKKGEKRADVRVETSDRVGGAVAGE